MKDLAAEARAVLTRLAAGPGIASPPVLPPDIAAIIDHTLLRPEAIEADVRRLCLEARSHGFASVCLNPAYVPVAARLLAGSAVRVGTVAGFPLGASSTAAKIFEIRDAASLGAVEIDVVAPLGPLKDGDHRRVLAELEALTGAARDHGMILKVILETSLLTDLEKAIGTLLVRESGADFVKTSTGFGPKGAVPADVRILRAAGGPALGVKAAGGIRDYEKATALLAAGATRIGTSSGVRIVEQAFLVAGKGEPE